jgi:hypothetical protein
MVRTNILGAQSHETWEYFVETEHRVGWGHTAFLQLRTTPVGSTESRECNVAWDNGSSFIRNGDNSVKNALRKLDYKLREQKELKIGIEGEQ